MEELEFPYEIIRSSVKRKTIEYYLDRMGKYFSKIEPFSTAGDIRPPYPYQWRAESICFGDDCFEGLGDSPLEAIKSLYNEMMKGLRKRGIFYK